MPTHPLTPKQVALLRAFDADEAAIRSRRNLYVQAILDGADLAPPPSVTLDLDAGRITWDDPPPQEDVA
jgi:hypothetical protein